MEDKELKTLRASIDQTEVEIAALKSKSELLPKEITAAVSAHEARLASFEQQRVDVPKRMAQLEEKLAALKAKLPTKDE